MITVKSNATEDVTLHFEGNDVHVIAGEAVDLPNDQAKFVLETLGFCEVVTKAPKASVPPTPKKTTKKEEAVVEEKEDK